jgi:hypothetical protein
MVEIGKTLSLDGTHLFGGIKRRQNCCVFLTHSMCIKFYGVESCVLLC